MSLIVGRLIAGRVYLIGDTALTFFADQKANPFVEGCLKQYIVNDGLAIAFAGNSEDFQATSGDLLSSRSGDEVVRIALDAASNGMDFDLLVADTGREAIRFIKGGVVSESTAGYVGDSSGFAAFQRYFNSLDQVSLKGEEGRALIQILRLPEPIAEDDIYTRLYGAMKRVIQDPAVPSVGGVIVPLCIDRGRFRYLNYADVTSDQMRLEDLRDGPKRVEFGTAVGGGYSVEFCDDSGFGGEGRNVGLYFLQGGFGVVFPSDSRGFRRAQILRASNPAYWVLNTARLFGSGIGCGFLTEDHCGVAGEELLKSGNDEDALFCYELRKESKTLEERPAVCDRYFAGYATAMFNSGRRTGAISILENRLQRRKTSRACSAALQRMIGALSHGTEFR